MKKVLILVALVLTVSTVAYAQKSTATPKQAPCPMMADNATPCPKDCGNYHSGKGYNKGKNNTDAPKITLDDAKAKVADYIKTNLKGYTVKDVKEFTTKRGDKAFTADVKDASGNEFVLHVTPWGDVRGPIHMPKK